MYTLNKIMKIFEIKWNLKPEREREREKERETERKKDKTSFEIIN